MAAAFQALRVHGYWELVRNGKEFVVSGVSH